MRAKKRKILIISSSVVLVGGIVGGSVAAAFNLNNATSNENVEPSIVVSDFYSSGEAHTNTTNNPDKNPIRWTAPEEDNFYQHLFYIAVESNSMPGVPGYIMLADPSRYTAGDPAQSAAGVTWQQLTLGNNPDDVSGFNFITQYDQNGWSNYSNGHAPGQPWNWTDLSTAFYFDEAVSHGNKIGKSILVPAIYSPTTQLHSKNFNYFLEVGSYYGETNNILDTNTYQFQIDDGRDMTTDWVADIVPSNDVQIWDDAVYTSYEIIFENGTKIASPEQVDFFADEQAVQTNNSSLVIDPTLPQDDIFLFPVLTVQQDASASVNGDLVLYMTFGGFQTDPNNKVSYKVTEYGTNTTVKDWTLIGAFQSMDDYKLTISGLPDGVYNVQFSSSFAYQCWAEYKFTVGENAPQYSFTKEEFYNQFPEAAATSEFGYFYLVDPNTGMVIHYEDMYVTNNGATNFIWGSASTPLDYNTGHELGGNVAPVFRVDTAYNNFGQKNLDLWNYSDFGGRKPVSFGNDMYIHTYDAAMHQPGDIDEGSLDEFFTFYVDGDNVTHFGSIDYYDESNGGSTTAPSWNQNWGKEIISSGMAVGENITWVDHLSGDSSKPSGTQDDGFILLPTLSQYNQSVKSNSFTTSLALDIYQNTTYNLYYSVTPVGGTEGPKVHIGSSSSSLYKTITIPNLTPSTEYIFNFYISNAADSTLFPEVANKLYCTASYKISTPASTGKIANPDDIKISNESVLAQDLNGDGDETDHTIYVDNTDISGEYLWSGDLNSSTFTLEVTDMGDNIIIQDQPLDPYLFYTNTKETRALSTEAIDIPSGQYRAKIYHTNGGAPVEIFNEFITIDNSFTLGQITEVIDETETGSDVSGDGEANDIVAEFTTDYNNEYKATYNSRFYIDVYDKTNDETIISKHYVDPTLFEGVNTSTKFVLGEDTQLPKAEIEIKIVEEKQYGGSAVIDVATFDNTGLVEEKDATVNNIMMTTTSADVITDEANEYNSTTMKSSFYLVVEDPVTNAIVNYISISEAVFDKNNNTKPGSRVKLKTPLKFGLTYNISIYQMQSDALEPTEIYTQSTTIDQLGW